MYPDKRAINKIIIARNCCQRRDPAKTDFVKAIHNLFKSGHLSVLEHANATFKFEGISRVTSHQLVRHRLMSFCQESNRAVPARSASLVVPPAVLQLVSQDSLAEELLHAFLDANEAFYAYLGDKDILEQDIRYFVPHGVTTALTVTANFRNWIHFVLLRTHPSAQWEIREMAIRVYDVLADFYPEVFNLKNLAEIRYAPEFEDEHLDFECEISSIEM